MPFSILGWPAPAPVHEGLHHALSAGRSSGSRFVLLAAPSHPPLADSGLVRRSSPVTAAGPRRSFTAFPIKAPKGHPRNVP